MSFFKQPLLHFLLLGALIFVGSSWFYQTENDKLVISRNSFLEFLQLRNKGIGNSSAEQILATLSDKQKQALLTKHVAEEVLYHQALNLGLDKKDYVIKQRLIQKMEYLLEGASTDAASLEQADVEAYFERSAKRYFAPATVTFTHVFINSNQAESKERAKNLKLQLNQQQVPFEQATRYGDRFVYYPNYVERNKDFIASHFGPDFGEYIFNQKPSAQQWLGPVQSDYGWHVVKLVAHQDGGTPHLSTIYNRVLQDAQLEKNKQQRLTQVRELIDSYGLVLPKLAPADPAK